MSTALRHLGWMLVGASSMLGLVKFANPSAEAQSTSLAVRELRIVDDNGQARIRLGAPLPDPKGLKRAMKAYGIQFMDGAGREVGGLAMLDAVGIRGLCFDTEEGYSPMCVSLIKGQPNITLADKSNDRIVLGVTDGVAAVTLSDAAGAVRVRMEVDPKGATKIEGVSPPASGK